MTIINELKTGAHHEAGHTVLAYYCKWRVNDITFIFNEKGEVVHGKTNYDFGDDKPIVDSFSTPSLISTLSNKQNKRFFGVALRRIWSLFGGPLSEAFIIKGIGYKGILEIDLRGPDSHNSYGIDEIVRAYTKEQINIKEQLVFLDILIRNNIFWNTISEISEQILNSKNHILRKEEIEKTIIKNNFLDYDNNQIIFN